MLFGVPLLPPALHAAVPVPGGLGYEVKGARGQV